MLKAGLGKCFITDKMPLRLNVKSVFNKDWTQCHSEYMYCE